ncbi:winged helix-turn-helix transcriptional regulator [Methylovirgula sp. 4M-Z18]|uniref:winged helix-turn-helix transcriptional regulator n=1 Tax=Methylovirgula sp. 4M-Z18 TaxID=2293567 RepID=UPI000E2F28AF|nr:helix-turn-helix domain-containing protein [Methylovirgula sp. 4M-Z18]RFB80505.1 transcriptional regulator [Methylovirgula sp. 4M-Z18]
MNDDWPRDPNPFSAACPSRIIFDHIADKWTMLTLCTLAMKPIRFNELKREVEGISQKMLSQTLKKLERDGLITRQAFPTVPVTVEYAITPLGQTLSCVAANIAAWTTNHIAEVLAAQERYDRQNLDGPAFQGIK